MNRLFPLCVLALCAPALCALAAPAPELPAAGVLLDSYAAIVNGRVITVGDVLAALQPTQARLAALYDGPELEEQLLAEYEKVRANLVEAELILLDFETQGGSVPDHAVENHINTVIHERFADDRTAFLRALAAERLTFSAWRQQMKEQLIVQIMRQREVSAKILITPLDLQTAYDRRRADFLLPERVRIRTLTVPRGADESAHRAARDRLAGLRARLLAGDLAFAQAATAGITLGDDDALIETGSLAEPIRNALTPLAPGGISEPVEIGAELYLVQLVEREAARTRSLAEASPELERDLRRAEFERLYRIWIDSLRSKYFVQTYSHDLFAR